MHRLDSNGIVDSTRSQLVCRRRRLYFSPASPVFPSGLKPLLFVVKSIDLETKGQYEWQQSTQSALTHSMFIARQATDGRLSISPVKYFLLIHYGPGRQEVRKVQGDSAGRRWEVGLDISRATAPAGLFIEVRRNCLLPCFRSLLATGTLTIERIEEARRTVTRHISIRLNSKSDTSSLEVKLTPVPLTRVHPPGSAPRGTVPSTPSTSHPSRTPFCNGNSAVPTIPEHSHLPSATDGSQVPRVPVAQPPPLSTSAGHSGSHVMPPPEVPILAVAYLPSIPSISRASSQSRPEVVSLTESMNLRSSPSQLVPHEPGVSDTSPSTSTSLPSKAAPPTVKTVLQDSPTAMDNADLPFVPSTNSSSKTSSLPETTIMTPAPEFQNGVSPPAGCGLGPTCAHVTPLSPTLPPPSSANSSQVKRTEMTRQVPGTTGRSSSHSLSRRKGKSVEPRASEVGKATSTLDRSRRSAVPVTPDPNFSIPPLRRFDTSRSFEKPDSSQIRTTDTSRPDTPPLPPPPPHSSPPVSRRSSRSSRLSSRRVPVPDLELKDSPLVLDEAHPEHVVVASPLPTLPLTELGLREPPRGTRTGTNEQGVRAPSAPPPLTGRRRSSRTPSRRGTQVSEPETSASVPNETHRYVSVIPSASSIPPPKRSSTQETAPRISGETKVTGQDDFPSSTPPISRKSSNRSAYGTQKSTAPGLERENLPSKPDRSHRQHVPPAPLSPSNVPPGRSDERLPTKGSFDPIDTRRPDTPSSLSSMSRSPSKRSTRRAAPVQDLKGQPPLLNGSSRRSSNSSTISRTAPSLKKASRVPPSGTNTNRDKDSNTRPPTSKKSSQHEPTYTPSVMNGSHQQRTQRTRRSSSVTSLKDPNSSRQTDGRNHHVDSPVPF
ncbi:hypothetical protein PQX77_002862 [Marasmius sp. AFHP31]|nr:hypothetical protein PQX77_002862 [Marasmius sp. AFHP31]